ncbi:MAG: JAB domain-containing protein [bacterium]|nr:JAB domain-containing protein [bacterium]
MPGKKEREKDLKQKKEQKNVHEGHRQRMREKIMKTPDAVLLEHELLETLLFYVIPRGDTNPLAHNIIDTFGSVSAALESSTEDLKKVRGVGDKTAEYLNLLGKFGRVYSHICHQKTEYNLDSRVTQEYLKKLFNNIEKEQVYILCLDFRNNIVKRLLLFEGTFDSVDVDLRDTLKNALSSDAKTVVCVHNHPSGIARPSYADKLSTAKMQEAFELVGIEFKDSIIVTDTQIYGIISKKMVDL